MELRLLWTGSRSGDAAELRSLPWVGDSVCVPVTGVGHGFLRYAPECETVPTLLPTIHAGTSPPTTLSPVDTVAFTGSSARGG
ncbi:hypothetical protein GEV33_013688 [Tenebrio molitor]|uniref:Uncharacterized protein n=1 Tax=Tenebrio molitor TaxID=7067 RepID=A0A8J6H7D9_TENMO|nr:hypothetical protein GEV33_013688 [Tenebrio molitor]